MFYWRKNGFLVILIIWNCLVVKDFTNGQYNSNPYKCSYRLETALDHILERSQLKSGSRSYIDITPYKVYETLYNNNNENKHDDDDNNPYDKDASLQLEESNERSNIKLNEKLDKFYENNYNRNDHNNKNHHQTQHNHQSTNNNHIPISHIDVANLKVRLPTSHGKWVHVDKCEFIANNNTLDTRLVFPDLTISGQIVLHPNGKKCNMILRLRRAGIEFRTTPIQKHPHSHHHTKKVLDADGTASVRTDSHFSEPGFLSVFAHGCKSSSIDGGGNKYRKNSKRRLFYNHNNDHTNRRHDKNYYNNNNYYHPGEFHYTDFHKRFKRSEQQRIVNDQNDDANDSLNFDDGLFDNDLLADHTTSRTFDDFFVSSSNSFNRYNRRKHKYDYRQHQIPQFHQQPQIQQHNTQYHHDRYPNTNQWHNIRPQEEPYYNSNIDINNHNDGNNNNNNDEADDEYMKDDELSRELEQLFSMGVRGMLTTYMQKALQPAIKETLMENLGYTLSYG